MSLHRSNTVTWAITIAYGLLVFAVESLHLLPGCSHNHSTCCATAPSKAALHKHEQSCCKHLHAHAKSKWVEGKDLDSLHDCNATYLHLVSKHSGCQVCKLMASLSIHLQSIEYVSVQIELVCSAPLFFDSHPLNNVVSGVCIRGPPAI